jgi:adenine-specific DNA-methyltransferase
MMNLLDQADIRRIKSSNKRSESTKAKYGQFFTSATLAKLLASYFKEIRGDVKLLDPGAGVGILSAAFTERILSNPNSVTNYEIIAYEIDLDLCTELEKTLIECCDAVRAKGIPAKYKIITEDFLKKETEYFRNPLFEQERAKYTHSIQNPPYKKISSDSLERKLLSQAGIETVNLYTAFLWLTILRLQDDGELVSITPRSFCNGTYYRPFRKILFHEVSINSIHVFESREDAFSDEKVLQENIILHGIKTRQKNEVVKIISSKSAEIDENLREKLVSYEDVVEPTDRDLIIHLVTDSNEKAIKTQMNSFSSSLEDLGLQVSTGQIVDFRMKNYIFRENREGSVPLIYSECIRNNQIKWPPKNPKKPFAIDKNLSIGKFLLTPGWYIVIKRFSSKEEKRRIVSACITPEINTIFGIENHLNYFHSNGKSIEKYLAIGLSTFLNSTLFDNYFRQFSGHTQVNASDLRRVKYPKRDELINLGKLVGEKTLGQDEIDRFVQEEISLMPSTVNAVQSTKKIQEAMQILKELDADREQLNERSALCLLALANISPDREWREAGKPLRRITEMMEWFDANYEKKYAPNTRETVRRLTMHQFVQMGIAVENPDKRERPINSPKWCYQLSEEAHKLLQVFGTSEWKNALANYKKTISNDLSPRHRDLPQIAVILPEGSTIHLTAGGQNELIKMIVEEFCPRFTPGGEVIYIGDAGQKFVVNEVERFLEMGINIDPHGKMPDVVIYDDKHDWLVIIEAVIHHGPVDKKRRNELKSLFGDSKKGLVFVTAFLSRSKMTEYLARISWETEAWVADDPDHLIHFNGERFLGPYDD